MAKIIYNESIPRGMQWPQRGYSIEEITRAYKKTKRLMRSPS